jgi:hypothetical protein
MWFDRSVKALAEQYEARIADKNELLLDQRQRIAALEADTERMRMILMPLSSAPGAAYSRSKAVQNMPSRSLSSVPPPSTDWQSFLGKHMTELEKEKETTSGTQS